jgi:hypothetical protein
MADHDAAATQASRKEIYTYKAPWTVYSMSWSRRCVSDESSCAFRWLFPISSFCSHSVHLLSLCLSLSRSSSH